MNTRTLRAADAPVLPQVARLAMPLLATRQKLSYDFLARSHFVQLHQTTALLSENEQLRSDLAKALQLAEDYDRHSTQAVDYLQREAIPSPDWTALLRTINSRYPELGHEQADTETILQTFIDEELKQYEAADGEFWEQMEDNTTTADQQPGFSEDLLHAAATLASRKKETFATLAVQVQRLQSQIGNLHEVNETIGRLAFTWKTAYEQMVEAAQGISDRFDKIVADTALLVEELTAYRNSSNPDTRQN